MFQDGEAFVTDSFERDDRLEKAGIPSIGIPALVARLSLFAASQMAPIHEVTPSVVAMAVRMAVSS